MIGKCSICGGIVSMPAAQSGNMSVVPTCQNCGAIAKLSVPVIDMDPAPSDETATIVIRGGVAAVDIRDLPLVRGRTWRAKKIGNVTYAACWLGKDEGNKDATMHRLILGFPTGNIDHKDGNGLNNSRSNLRLATIAENAINCRQHPRGSGFRGVSFHKQSGLWRVTCKNKTISSHTEPLEAALAYDHAARKMYGEFARLNFAGTK